MGGDEELTHRPLGRGPAPRRAADGSVSTLHGDPQRTDRIAAHGPRHPEIVWSVDVGGAVEAQPIASLDSRFLYIATLGGELHALDRPTGHALWTVPLGGRSYATPTVGPDGTIYARQRRQAPLRRRPRSARSAGSSSCKARRTPAFSSSAAVTSSSRPARTSTAFTPMAPSPGASTPAGRSSPRRARTDKDGIVFGAQDHNAYGVGADGRLLYKVDLAADVDGSPGRRRARHRLLRHRWRRHRGHRPARRHQVDPPRSPATSAAPCRSHATATSSEECTDRPPASSA